VRLGFLDGVGDVGMFVDVEHAPDLIVGAASASPLIP
jgi:hypothetical protein